MAVFGQPIQDSSSGTDEQFRLQYPTSPQATDSPFGVPPLEDTSKAVSTTEPEMDFFRAAFDATRGNPWGEATQGGAVQEQTSEGGQAGGTSQDQPGGQPVTPGETGAGAGSTETGKTDTPGVLTVTQEELDRRVQAETDRRQSKWLTEQRQQASQTAARREQEELNRLLEEKPYEYAQRVRQIKTQRETRERALGDQQALANETLETYDETVLRPMLRMLPEDAQARVLSSDEGIGIPGRGRLAQAAWKELEKQWTDKGVQSARERLMNDEGFIKEVLTRYSGGRAPEPEHITAMGGASDAPRTEEQVMNDSIRHMASGILGRRRG